MDAVTILMPIQQALLEAQKRPRDGRKDSSTRQRSCRVRASLQSLLSRGYGVAASGFCLCIQCWVGRRSRVDNAVCAGSQVKIMRCAGLGPPAPSGRQAFDAGLGAQWDLQAGRISPVVRRCDALQMRRQRAQHQCDRMWLPIDTVGWRWPEAAVVRAVQVIMGLLLQMRLRFQDSLRIKLAPEPVFKLKHIFDLFDTGMAIGVAFQQPLVSDIRELGKSGAPSAPAHVRPGWAHGVKFHQLQDHLR